MRAGLEELVQSLLFEGYALYPYTPGSTKNATPTPFGIVYPPAYAALSGATFDHLQMECVLRVGPETTIQASVRFLVSSGDAHKASEHSVEMDPVALSELSEPLDLAFRQGSVEGRLILSHAPGSGTDHRVMLRVENTTSVGDEDPASLGRAGALSYSLISTHPLLQAKGGTFLSPLDVSACDNVNTWPVLATDVDDTMLGATIVLPDHPAIAPQSRGNLFDGTEIEEALLLHIQTLSDEEREGIAAQDPAVREMIERAAAATAGDIIDLHGVVRPVDTSSMHTSPIGAGPEEVRGEEQIEVDGTTFRRGDHVLLAPGERVRPEDRKDVFDLMLEGRTATIERIYLDYEDKIYFGVTVDGDPGQELMREMGRYLFFFVDEVEAIRT